MEIKDAQLFGKYVRKYRKSQGLTQIQLSIVANVSPRFIGELEHGKPTIELDKALKVAWLLGLRLSVSDKD